MVQYFIQRILQSVLLLIGVSIIVFFMMRLTGDPVSLMVSRDATMEQRQAFAEAHGFNRSVGEQFIDYIKGLLQGDLGDSLQYRVPATQLLAQRLPPTFELAILSLILALVIGIPLGAIGGIFPNSWMDVLARFIGLLGQTIPSFWLAMLLVFFVAVPIDFLPTFGRKGVESLILPTFALGFGGVAQLVRLTRATVLEVMGENYIRTAAAKGLNPYYVSIHYVLRNAALPIISIVGIQFTYLLGGSVYIESIFSWPGLGTLLENAINNRDFPMVQAITFFIALFAISVNLLTDLVYMVVDPRIRSAAS